MRQKNIPQLYVEHMAKYLSVTRNQPEESFIPQLKEYVENNIQLFDIDIVSQVSPGVIKRHERNVLEVLKSCKNDVLTPSGSAYVSTNKQVSMISQMVIDKLKERKIYKKKQLEAAAKGDKAEEMRCLYRQATIKINCNSLPGGFGSAYNLFYDKGGYNAITSLARSLIKTAYLYTERVLSGNFLLVDEEMAINHMITKLHKAPSLEEIEQTVTYYKLLYVSKDQLTNFIYNTINKYKTPTNFDIVRNFINGLDDKLVTWLYYHENLKHIIETNGDNFRKWITNTLDTSQYHTLPPQDPKGLLQLPETIQILLSTLLHQELGGKQLYELTSLDPDKASKFIAFGQYLHSRMGGLERLFEVFIYPRSVPQLVERAPELWRSTVIVSDTDSVIFTTKGWVEWYLGELQDNQDSYNLSALVICWLVKAMEQMMWRFGESHGATDEGKLRLVMKNEFFYPSMLIFEQKKTYAGVVYIQEGIVLPSPKIDLKGGLLRGSSMCKHTGDVVEEFIVNRVLKASMQGKLSAWELIKYIVDFERKIQESLLAGETTYLKITSIQPEAHYKKPEITDYYHYQTWQMLFSKEYGDIAIPSKVPIVELVPINKKVIDSLLPIDSVTHERLKQLFETRKRLTYITINPVLTTMPRALIPLINVRSVILHNTAPLYMVLKSLNISVPHEKQKLLLSDIY